MERDIEFRRAMIALKNDDLRSYEHLMKKWAVASAFFKTEDNALFRTEYNYYQYACDNADCVCRQDVNWPENIANGCISSGQA